MTFQPKQPLLLAGPTAVGKSEIALLVAEQLGGEIISVDSMQVYRGLDIGTAKPSAAERKRVPHHLVDVVDLTTAFSAAEFVSSAQAAITDIQARGKVPLLCGGTGLYFKALLQGLGEAPPADPALRAELGQTPLAQLLTELERADPATFASIDRQNPRRVIRAVSVIRLTGKPYSEQRAQWDGGPMPTSMSCVSFGLARLPEDLKERISRRVDQMFDQGLVEETRSLLDRGLSDNPIALQALGYRQVTDYLRGNLSLPAAVELVKKRTRLFAKRQMTWFQRQLELNWITLERDSAPEAVAERITLLYRQTAQPVP